jgi:hypothetical protein
VRHDEIAERVVAALEAQFLDEARIARVIARAEALASGGVEQDTTELRALERKIRRLGGLFADEEDDLEAARLRKQLQELRAKRRSRPVVDLPGFADSAEFEAASDVGNCGSGSIGRLDDQCGPEDPNLARLWTMDAAEFESLPEAESIRIRSFLNLQLTMLYRHFYFAKDGAIRGAVWEAEIRVTKPLLRQAWVRQHWSEMRYVYSDEFVEFVDGLIREGEAAE